MHVFAALLVGLLVLAGPGVLPASAQNQSDSTYTVQDGDTLYEIAQKTGVSVQTLVHWNDLDDPSIQTGQTLRVRPPAASGDTTVSPPESPPDTAAAGPDAADAAGSSSSSADTADTGAAQPPPYGRHAVESVDTFVNLALRLGTTADTLFALNDSTTAPLASGRSLRLPRRFGPPVHSVKKGQTLYSIAGEYGVSVRSLKAENDLTSDTLQPGQTLHIPHGPGPDLPPPGKWTAPDTTGPAARYPKAFAGRLTASGTAYNPEDLVVSHPSLPFDSVVLLSTKNPERHTFARVLDRGPIKEDMLLDVSAAVAEQLSLPTEGTAPTVALRVVWTAE
ncbi:MAG: peptidoglycan-binding protein LysM [Bacteroidetes bacterium SW_9_63_38]|nr:MAG: peptidoglycan-binding protein LysM [Bacteroidetes bacterium SW_9_63_38]